MIKNLKRTATMTISPPAPDGNSVVKIKSENIVEMEMEFGIRHDAAMKMMFEMLLENQVSLARGRLYKH